MVKRLSIIALALAVILSGCEKNHTVVPTLAEPIGTDNDTAVVFRGDIFELSTFDAKVYPDIQEISCTIDGTVKDTAVYLGQEVKEGDLLITMNDEDRSKELIKLKDELESNLQDNALELEKQELDIKIQELNILQKKEQNAPIIEIAKLEADLKKQKLIKDQTLELQEYDIDNKKEKIGKIEAELDQYKILAPCSGRIVYMNNLGRNSRLNAYEPVMIISDDSKLHIQSTLISSYQLTSASQVYALIKGKQYELNYIPFETDELMKMNNSGTQLETKYEFKPDPNIVSGDYACVCLVENLKKDVLMMPKNALYSDAEGDFVYRINNGELEKSNVVLGTKTEVQVEIISGLSEGDVVYVQK